ncbi:peptidoglycan editing factor PgeF [Methyloligella sp. 2.7D]|uniref:peptidoglycan editing factor PgeF n=1 Tax=unclassified Methyloligella TaxID=2625955 RepID=UPI00157DF802|nr:peptidoglycan editing factor PgeF [Methyloligella sp. GL2]QKP77036.1 peptidoglycan editing factor PgeF [Methyloligella sp. GL2]
MTPDQAKLCASELNQQPAVRHGFFTRQGGISAGIYESLNCGSGSKDEAASVKQNRALVAEALGVAPERLITPYQIHSATAVIVEEPWKDGKAPEADAIVTATPGLAVGILTADCTPVLFCEPDARIAAAAHAGWRGALTGIVEATVGKMAELGANPEKIIAAIGPCISRTIYEVGADYRDNFLKEDPEAEEFFVTDESTGEPHFDLASYVVERLDRAGVETIADMSHCTYCDEARFFSYRRSQHWGENDYGRQISAIVLT